MFRHAGAEYFNPDEAARRILAANPGLSIEDANSAAWHQGRRLLERAIAERLSDISSLEGTTCEVHDGRRV